MRTFGFTIVVAAVLAAAALAGWGTPAGAQRLDPREVGKDPRIWRAFRPLVLATGGGDADRAVKYLSQGSEILRKADAKLELDERTLAFRTESRKSLERFDFEEFYELLPDKRGAYRRIAVAGAPAANSYQVKVAQGDAFEVGAAGTRRGFGESSVVVRARPVERGDSDRYLVQWRGGVGVGPISFADVLSGVSDGLRVLETSVHDDVPVVLKAADAYLRKSQPELGAEDRRVLSVGWASFVKVAEFLTSISRSEDVRGPEPIDGCTPVRLVSRWSAQRIGRDYPEAAEYLEDLGKLMDAHVHVTDAAGLTLAKGRFDTQRLRSELTTFVQDGRIVPSKRGKPLPQRSANYSRMTARLDLHFVMHGIHLFVDNLRVNLRYRERPGGASLHAQAVTTPRIRVKGTAFGMLPAGMLDWFIPGDVEGLATRLFEAAVKGNEGRGVALFARFHRPEGGLATVNGTAGREVLDNALVRFGMAIVSNRVIPDDGQQADLERLAVAYRDAFDADLSRFARFGTVP